jgi:PKD repeat protein
LGAIPVLAQVQNTYVLADSRDHSSIAPSVTEQGNHVVASTLTNPVTNQTSVYVKEVDALGAAIWERVYVTKFQEEVFHIGACPGTNTYYLCGYSNANGADNLFVMVIDAVGNIVNLASYDNVVGGTASYALHITKSQNDPIPGYVVVGFETGGPVEASPKQALVMKLDGNLNLLWSRHIDSPAGNFDFDMASHVVEAIGTGYFISGSSNRADGGDQIILAAMFEYDGNLLWDVEYDDNGGSGHYSVGASAYYDEATNEIYQLSNLSIIHHFGVNVFDAATGNRNVLKSYGVFSDLGYYNIQGFRIMESQDQANLVISGFLRDHNWSEDEDGDGQADAFFYGSVPFAMEVDKNATAILWDNIYLVPASNYNLPLDIFSAFSAGQQPRILHPEMAWTQEDGTGYVLAAFRGNAPKFDSEFIELDVNGDNSCSRADIALDFYQRVWIDENVLNIGGQPNNRVGLFFNDGNVVSDVTSCYSPAPCFPDATFEVVNMGQCCYSFSDKTPDNFVNCTRWDIIASDGTIIGTGQGENFVFCFPNSGTYMVCYYDCCITPDGQTYQSQSCQNIEVNCGCEQPTVQLDVVENGCSRTFTFLNSGGTPDAEVCIWTDLFGEVSLPFSWTEDFTGICDTYGICYAAFCCEDGYDPAVNPAICKDFVVNCCDGCIPDANFTILELGDCCYNFLDLTPDPNALNCQKWEIFDADGNIVNTGNGDSHYLCFTQSGTYTVCFTDCCVNADGTTTTDTVCQTINVDCGCELPAVLLDVAKDSCVWTFSLVSSDPNINAGGCVWTDLFGEVTLPFTWTQDFTGYCGEYDICYAPFCCDEGYDPDANPSTCLDYTIECCEDCTPDPNFHIHNLGECCYNFVDLTPDDNLPNCQRWDIYDAAGNLVNVGGGVSHYLCFQQSGTYTICYTDCCVTPDGTISTAISCQTIDVNCGCQPVPDFDFTVFQGPNDCEVAGFCPTFNFNVEGYCATWDFGDGSTSGPLVGQDMLICPIHTYDCAGAYTVCLTLTCCDDPSITKTICRDIIVDCGCRLPSQAGISVQNNGCTSYFGLISTDDSCGELCVNWDFGDGTAGSGWAPNHTYAASGTYNVCAYIQCCDNPDEVMVRCIEVIVDCGECIPDANFSIIQTLYGECCYEFTDLTPSVNALPNCQKWEIFDAFGNLVNMGVGVHHGFCFPESGTYEICYTDCCENLVGGITTDTVCQTIEVDCGNCSANADFYVNKKQDCCYDFGDLTITGASCIERKWEISDAFGNVLFSDGSSQIQFCFPQSGSYTVCYTDCCISPNGTVVIDTVCKTIDVNCGCDQPVVLVDVVKNDCVWTFSLVNSVANPNEEVCVWTDLFGEVALPFTWTQDFTGYCGNYGICYAPFCCEEGYNPNANPPVCTNYYVDCCDGCTLDPNFIIEDLGDCCYKFIDPTPSLTPLNCQVWNIFDEANNLINLGEGEVYSLCFADPGTYTVCFTDCCQNPDGTITTVIWCQTLVVDCACEPVGDFYFDVYQNGDPCDQAGFCPYFNFDVEGYCATWDFGDGTSTGPLVGQDMLICPIHTYDCAGTYSVCLTLTCCDDPSITKTFCRDVVVDCGCKLPSQVYYTTQECNALFTIEGTDDYCGDICVKWDFGDGTIANGWTVEHTYQGSGTYVVCAEITCCSDPSEVLVICEEIQVYCPCVPKAGFELSGETVYINGQCYLDLYADLYEHDFDPDVTGDNCDYWTIYDSNGTFLMQLSGSDFGNGWDFTYVIEAGCYTVCRTECCFNQDGTVSTVTYCQDICGDCCEQPVAHVDVVKNGCVWTFSLVNSAVNSDAEVCVWTDLFGEVALPFTWSQDFTGYCGNYGICYAPFCCDEGFDPANNPKVCADYYVDCCDGCTLSPNFIIEDLGDCCYKFIDPTPSITPLNCQVWNVFDSAGNLVNIGQGDTYSLCFAEPGTYSICFTDCCINPDGSIKSEVFCQTLIVNCACEPVGDFDFDVFQSWNTCGQVGFCPTFNFNVDGYCATWDFGDGSTSGVLTGTDMLICPIHTYDCAGTYSVCLTLTCCDDPSITKTICKDVVVDCGCKLPSDAGITVQSDACTSYFGLYSTDDFCGDICVNWDFGDGSTGSGWTPNHTYAASGTYTVCAYIQCCNNPDEVIVRCIEVTVNCGCMPMGDFYFDVYQTANQCDLVGFCPWFNFNVEGYCATWDFGDGTTSGLLTGMDMLICPVHTYDCAGNYTVCLTLTCCDDPSLTKTVCRDVVVDCGCKLPSQATITYSTQDCNTIFSLESTDDSCGDICVNWDFGDGTSGSGWTAVHTYQGSGTYVVCAEIFCCDNPNDVMVVCQQIQVNCPCVPKAGFELSAEAVYIDGQCYMDLFADLYEHDTDPDISGDDCDYWTIYDVNGVLLMQLSASDFGNGWDFTYVLEAGCYTVCRTECCFNQDGTVNTVTYCQEICRDCGCCPNPEWTSTSGDACGEVIFSNPDCAPDNGSVWWDFGDGTSGNGNNPIHVYSEPGTYLVCMTVCCSNGDGTVTSQVVCNEIVVEPCLCVPNADFTWGYTVVNNQCCVTFKDLTPDGNIGECESWVFGDIIAQLAGDEVTFCFPGPGVYTVCHYDCCVDAYGNTTLDVICHEVVVDCNNDCVNPAQIDSDVVCLQVYEPVCGCNGVTYYNECDAYYNGGVTSWTAGPCPVINPDCTVHPAFLSVAEGCNVFFKNQSFLGAGTNLLSYTWDFGDGTSSDEANPVHSYNGTGYYTVCLTVSGSTGNDVCSQSFCWEIAVNCDPPCPADINGDGIVNTADLLELLANYLLVCP